MFAKKLSRREMAVWCAALALGCVLAGLSGFALDWGRAQLDTGAALCADTLRLHIKADSDSLQDQTAKLAVRDALLAYTDAQCRASTQPEALHWAAQNLPALELTAGGPGGTGEHVLCRHPVSKRRPSRRAVRRPAPHAGGE